MFETMFDLPVETLVLCAVLAFTLTEYFWKAYLSYRQRRIYRSTTCLPQELCNFKAPRTFAKLRIYHLDKSNSSFWFELFSEIIWVLILLLGGIPFLWDVAGSVAAHLDLNPECEIHQSMVFVTLTILLKCLNELPWSVHHTLIGKKHSFKQQAFFVDVVKKSVLTLLICLPTTPVFLSFLKFSGDYFFCAWLFNMVASLVFQITIHDYAPPLLEKFTPLPAGELKIAIEAMAHSISFPLTKIQVVKGSSRLSHNNIYSYGSFRNKHIVLFDALLENKSPPNRKNMKLRSNNPEILAIVAHELGHWKLHHSAKTFVIQQMSSFLWFFLFSVLSGHKEPFVAFGFTDSQPAIIGFVIFHLIISPYQKLLSFCLTVLSRRFEFQADAFARSLGKASELRSALIKLNKDNLGFPVADWLFSMWHYSHPPLLERLRALGNAKQD